jgi:glutamate-1-semialdehyde 2,1-aminomutase
MFGFYFRRDLPVNYASVMASQPTQFNHFFHGMLEQGVYFAPAMYEAGFVSAAHTEDDIAITIAAAQHFWRAHLAA